MRSKSKTINSSFLPLTSSSSCFPSTSHSEFLFKDHSYSRDDDYENPQHTKTSASSLINHPNSNNHQNQRFRKSASPSVMIQSDPLLKSSSILLLIMILFSNISFSISSISSLSSLSSSSPSTTPPPPPSSSQMITTIRSLKDHNILIDPPQTDNEGGKYEPSIQRIAPTSSSSESLASPTSLPLHPQSSFKHHRIIVQDDERSQVVTTEGKNCDSHSHPCHAVMKDNISLLINKNFNSLVPLPKSSRLNRPIKH